MTCDYCKVQINWAQDFITDFLSSIGQFLNLKNWLLKVIPCLIEILDLKIAISKLVVTVNQQNWSVKYNFLSYPIFDPFKFFNRLLSVSKSVQALSDPTACFYILIYPKTQCLRWHFKIWALIFIFLFTVLDLVVVKFGYLLIARKTWLVLFLQQHALTL